MFWRCEYFPLKIEWHHHNRNNLAITVQQMFGSLRNNIGIARNSTGSRLHSGNG